MSGDQTGNPDLEIALLLKCPDQQPTRDLLGERPSWQVSLAAVSDPLSQSARPFVAPSALTVAPLLLTDIA
jgi:hypothetical protein